MQEHSLENENKGLLAKFYSQQIEYKGVTKSYIFLFDHGERPSCESTILINVH